MSLSRFLLLRRLGLSRCLQLVAYLPSFLKLFLRLAGDPRVSLKSKLVLVGISAYLILPTDFLPDILLGFGQLDDLLVVYLGLKLFLRLCPRDVVQEHVKSIAAGH